MKDDADITLDPENWDEFRKLGHCMLDDMIDYLAQVRTRSVWKPVPEKIKQSLAEPLPIGESDAEQIYKEFKERILPYPTGNIHPRFWGWVMGNGTPLGMLADMLASGMNCHVAGYEQSASLVEETVIGWLSSLMGMAEGTSGLLVSGGTMANLIGLTVARNEKSDYDIRKLGLQGSDKPKLVLYCSTETHSWAQKAVELLGLGSESLRRIRVNDNYEIDLGELRSEIERDRRAGNKPFCVIGTAGTVNTGATDDLVSLAALCKEEKLWFHIDGAFGALAKLSPKFNYIVAGLEQADSIAFDLHKWMYLPFEAGCVLIKNREAHRNTFTLTPNYLVASDRGITAGGLIWSELGLQLSRSFRALKVWMSMKTHGSDRFGSLIERNIEQAQYLGRLIEANKDLELLATVSLNVVCFRYRHESLKEEELDSFNNEIMLRLQESGLAIISSTRLEGRLALRAAITNYRSRYEDFDLLIEAIDNIGKELIGLKDLYLAPAG